MNTEEMQKQIESMMPTPEQIVEHLDRKIEEARRLYKTANSDQKYILESLFPQLSESEDDRIRKNIKVALISMEDNLADFYSTHHTSQKELIAWLERVKVPSVSSDTDKSFINDIKSIINEAPGVFQSDKNRLITWLEKHIS